MARSREATEEREILTPLTEDEARKLMSDMATEVRRLRLLKEEKKRTDKEMNDDIKGSELELNRLSIVVDSKQEKRRQLCRVVYDYEAGKKYVFSPFVPGVVIAVEDLTDTDRQLQFPKLAAGDPAAAAMANPSGVDAPIVMEGRQVICSKCGALLPYEEAHSVELRNEAEELIETVFLCPNGQHRKGGEQPPDADTATS